MRIVWYFFAYVGDRDFRLTRVEGDTAWEGVLHDVVAEAPYGSLVDLLEQSTVGRDEMAYRLQVAVQKGEISREAAAAVLGNSRAESALKT